MTTPVFTSGFAEALRVFVDHKRALGHPYSGSVDLLHRFDAMCSTRFPGHCDLSQEVCLAWAVKAPAEGSNALRNRIAVIGRVRWFVYRFNHERT